MKTPTIPEESPLGVECDPGARQGTPHVCLPMTVRHEAILQTQTIHLDHVPPPLVIVRVPPKARILNNSDLRD